MTTMADNPPKAAPPPHKPPFAIQYKKLNWSVKIESDTVKSEIKAPGGGYDVAGSFDGTVELPCKDTNNGDKEVDYGPYTDGKPTLVLVLKLEQAPPKDFKAIKVWVDKVPFSLDAQTPNGSLVFLWGLHGFKTPKDHKFTLQNPNPFTVKLLFTVVLGKKE